MRHNWALRTLARLIERAVAEAGSQAVVCDGGGWEISTPAGVCKPDVFIVPRDIARAVIVEEYAELGIPQYWIVEHAPRPAIQVLTLADGT